MDPVYWLSEFLKEEYNLNILDFDDWVKSEHAEKYLWGNKSSNFRNKISYETIYKTWPHFYNQAGIPDKLMGVHSFRSGFYCLCILNAQKKGLSEKEIKMLAQLIAGWSTERDAAVYQKKELREQQASEGFVEEPTPEQLLGFDGNFIPLWK